MACSAQQLIVPGSTRQHIVAGLSFKTVVAGFAVQHIVAVSSLHHIVLATGRDTINEARASNRIQPGRSCNVDPSRDELIEGQHRPVGKLEGLNRRGPGHKRADFELIAGQRPANLQRIVGRPTQCDGTRRHSSAKYDAIAFTRRIGNRIRPVAGIEHITILPRTTSQDIIPTPA
ncbi:MAG: hypothetical protein EWM73_01195 [Nitrospira sp.]|nr:MAG: hypothetical protein EWM73_01195 [Nitrospira sp.]